jgi:hypothetical protein
MTLSATQLINLGLAYPLAGELKRQVDLEETIMGAATVAQRDIWTAQSAVTAAGTTISGALATTGDIVTVGSSSNSASDGVKLRTPSETSPRQVIINRHATSSVKVYPCNDISFIDGQARAGSVTVSPTQVATFYCANPSGTTVGSVTQYVFCGEY